jgi:hypothetical protein
MASINPMPHSQSFEVEKDASNPIDIVEPSAGTVESETSHPRNQKKRTFNFVSSISKDEPVVTRRELWSYYSPYLLLSPASVFKLNKLPTVYYNGDNVSP